MDIPVRRGGQNREKGGQNGEKSGQNGEKGGQYKVYGEMICQ